MQRDFDAQKTLHTSELQSIKLELDAAKVECDELRRTRARDLEAHTAREAQLEAQRTFLVASEERLRGRVTETKAAKAELEADFGQRLRGVEQEKRELQEAVDASAGVATQIAAEKRRREYAEESQQVNEQHLGAEVKRLNGRVQALEGKLQGQLARAGDLESQNTKLQHQHQAALTAVAASAAAAEASSAPAAESKHSASAERRFRAYEREIEHLNSVAENNLLLKGEVAKYREQLADAGKRLDTEVAATGTLRVEVEHLAMLQKEWEVIKGQSLEWCGTPLESIAQLGSFMFSMQQKVAAATKVKTKAEWDTRLLEQSSDHLKAQLAEAEQKCAALEQQQHASAMELHGEKGRASVLSIELEGFKERYSSIHEEVKESTDERNRAQRQSSAANDRIRELESALAAATAAAEAADAVDAGVDEAAADVVIADADQEEAAPDPADEEFDPFTVNGIN